MYGVNASIVSKLQRVQNTAARLVTRKKKYEHITPTLVALHWLPFKLRCQYKLLLYAFKALHGLAPSYLGELIIFTNRRDPCDVSVALIEMPKNAHELKYMVSGGLMWRSGLCGLAFQQVLEMNNLSRHLKRD